LSGGMKRRVSLGISLVGSPSVIFLDEPTTGLDPETKRNMWQLIERNKQGRVTVLTTHSMDEADALCSRIGIMARGELRCLGSGIHLKNKFGDEFKIDLVCEVAPTEAANAARFDAIDAHMLSLLPGAELVSKLPGRLTYRVLRSRVSISHVFGGMEQRPAELRILDWGLRQTSLEEVFLRIAEEAEA